MFKYATYFYIFNTKDATNTNELILKQFQKNFYFSSHFFFN